MQRVGAPAEVLFSHDALAEAPALRDALIRGIGPGAAPASESPLVRP